MGGQLAARKGDCVGAHTGAGSGGRFLMSALKWAGIGALAAGAVVGAVLAAPVVLGVGTVAGAAALIGGTTGATLAVTGGLLSGAAAGIGLQKTEEQSKPQKSGGGCSEINVGSENVFIEGFDKPAARAQTDTNVHTSPTKLNQGSESVFCNGKPLCRLEDKSCCGGKVITSASRTFVGGAPSDGGKGAEPISGPSFSWSDMDTWNWDGIETGLGVAGMVMGVGALGVAARAAVKAGGVAALKGMATEGAIGIGSGVGMSAAGSVVGGAVGGPVGAAGGALAGEALANATPTGRLSKLASKGWSKIKPSKAAVPPPHPPGGGRMNDYAHANETSAAQVEGLAAKTSDPVQAAKLREAAQKMRANAAASREHWEATRQARAKEYDLPPERVQGDEHAPKELRDKHLARIKAEEAAAAKAAAPAAQEKPGCSSCGLLGDGTQRLGSGAQFSGRLSTKRDRVIKRLMVTQFARQDGQGGRKNWRTKLSLGQRKVLGDRVVEVTQHLRSNMKQGNMIPDLESPRPGVVVQEKAEGISYEQLRADAMKRQGLDPSQKLSHKQRAQLENDDPVLRNAKEHRERLIADAEATLSQSGEGVRDAKKTLHAFDENGLVWNREGVLYGVDRNPGNFTYEPDGTPRSWFDPVVMRPVDPDAISAGAGRPLLSPDAGPAMPEPTRMGQKPAPEDQWKEFASGWRTEGADQAKTKVYSAKMRETVDAASAAARDGKSYTEVEGILSKGLQDARGAVGAEPYNYGTRGSNPGGFPLNESDFKAGGGRIADDVLESGLKRKASIKTDDPYVIDEEFGEYAPKIKLSDGTEIQGTRFYENDKAPLSFMYPGADDKNIGAKAHAASERLFNKAMDPATSQKDAVDAATELFYTQLHTVPYKQGGSSMAEGMFKSILEARGVETGPIKQGYGWDLLAWTRDLPTFKKELPTYFAQAPAREGAKAPPKVNIETSATTGAAVAAAEAKGAGKGTAGAAGAGPEACTTCGGAATETSAAATAAAAKQGLSSETPKAKAAAAKAGLDKAITDFVSTRGGGKKVLSQGELMDLVTHLGTEKRSMLDDLTANFSDRDAYPERPAVFLGDPESGPSVWLLGWREGDFTPIHDHGDSRAAVNVFKGPLEETVYNPNTLEVATSRSVPEGKTVPIPAPYIHKMGNSGAVTPEAVSIHAYDPPLKLMDYYEMKDGKLEFTGKWEDDEVALARTQKEREGGGGK